MHLMIHSKPKNYISPPTKKTGRKERCDKGTSKTSTALRIAGLLIDPEDENIRGTLKSIADSATEQKSIADSATVQNSEETMEVSILKEPMDLDRNDHQAQKPRVEDHKILQKIELTVS